MSSVGDWRAAVEPLRHLRNQGKDIRRARELGRLYQLAEEQGRQLLRRFDRWDEETRRDLVHDLLAAKLVALVEADNPRAWFNTALLNRARDEHRRRGRQALPTEPKDMDTRHPQADGDRVFVMDARAALVALSPRDRQIMTAVGAGEEREALAKEHGLSRAAVDQIVSRVRKRMRGGG